MQPARFRAGPAPSSDRYGPPPVFGFLTTDSHERIPAEEPREPHLAAHILATTDGTGVRSGLSLAVRLDVSLQPDPRTDPRLRLTAQVSPPIDLPPMCSDRPCTSAGHSPWGTP